MTNTRSIILTPKTDSSHSRTYLTTRNYTGPPLHPNIRSTCSIATFDRRQAMKSKPNVDVETDAPPLSSDEEDDSQTTTTSLKSLTKTRPSKPPQPERQSKRRKLQDEPQLDTLPDLKTVHNSMNDQNNLFDILSSSSQSQSRKRKLNASYAKRGSASNRIDQPSTETQMEEEKSKLIVLAPISDQRKNDGVLACKLMVETPTLRQLGSKSDEGPPILDISSLSEPFSSASTTGPPAPVLFDLPEIAGLARARSKSVSSAASVHSAVPFDVDVTQPEADKVEDVQMLSCPVCGKTMTRSEVAQDAPNPRLLSLKKQQDFCYRHRLREAESFWQEQGYPIIDWQVLEEKRIPKHIRYLKQVLQRKTSSFYLQKLDSVISNAKGSRKGIRSYLREGLVEIAPPGYYGPRGAKVMVHVVTEELSKNLSKALQADTAIRTAGVGPYVAAVLVPELTLQLVMEDLKLKDAEAARLILAESTDVGVLLHPDDDHIERNEDDE